MRLEPRICSGNWEVWFLGSQWLEASYPTDARENSATPVLLLLLCRLLVGLAFYTNN